MIVITVEKVKGATAAEFRKLLKRGVKDGLALGTKIAARETAKVVAKAYREAGSTGRDAPKSITLAKRKLGKLEGVGESVRTFRSVRSLYRSGDIARNIVTSKVGIHEWAVHVRPNVMGRETGAGPAVRRLTLDTIARMHETGFPVKFTMTRFSLAYLLILYGRINPKGTDRDPPDIVPTVHRFWVRKRPVWSVVVNTRSGEVAMRVRDQINTGLMRAFMRYTG